MAVLMSGGGPGASVLPVNDVKIPDAAEMLYLSRKKGGMTDVVYDSRFCKQHRRKEMRAPWVSAARETRGRASRNEGSKREARVRASRGEGSGEEATGTEPRILSQVTSHEY